MCEIDWGFMTGARRFVVASACSYKRIPSGCEHEIVNKVAQLRRQVEHTFARYLSGGRRHDRDCKCCLTRVSIV